MTQRATRIKGVHHATLHYRNQFGVTIAKKPRKPTVHCVPVDSMPVAVRARAMTCLDRWVPVVRLFLSMARVLRYEGDAAMKVWKAYCAGVYGKKAQA